MNDLQAPRWRWAVWGPLIGFALFVALVLRRPGAVDESSR